MKTFFSAVILIGIIFLTNCALAQTETKKPAVVEITPCEPDSLGGLIYYFPCTSADFRASFKNFMSKHPRMIATIQPDLINNFYDKNKRPINNSLEITGYYISLKPIDTLIRDY